MTLDDLEKVFWGDQREQPTRVRLARVVKALQDQFDFTSRGKSWSEGEVHDFFTETLGGFDAEEAAGDVNPDGAGISGLEDSAPAASGSPAAGPATCVWTPSIMSAGWWLPPHKNQFSATMPGLATHCPVCRLPIEFKPRP